MKKRERESQFNMYLLHSHKFVFVEKDVYAMWATPKTRLISEWIDIWDRVIGDRGVCPYMIIRLRHIGRSNLWDNAFSLSLSLSAHPLAIRQSN